MVAWLVFSVPIPRSNWRYRPHTIWNCFAAAAGQGVALTLKTLFEGYAAQGQLVKPFSLEVRDSAYYIVLSPEAVQKPPVKTFTDWLQREAAA